MECVILESWMDNRERWDGVSYFQVDYYTIALE